MNYDQMVELATNGPLWQRVTACAAVMHKDANPGAWVARNQWALTAALADANPTVTVDTVTDAMITAAVEATS